MDLFWKQSAGSGIGSEHKVFLRARLRLTALYVLIVAIIVFGFSAFLYQSIGRNLKDASEDDFAGQGSHRHFVENTLGTVENDLILADLFILIILAGLSFVLAGKTLKPIRSSIEAQKAFAANASHELRTPLAVMRNDIEVHLRNASPTKESAQGVMASNLEEIKRMSGMVEDLLLLARSDNRAVAEEKAFDMGAVIKSMVEKMKPLASSKNIKLAYTAGDSFIVKGVPEQLERVVLNILQNSIDHTPANGSIDATAGKDGTYGFFRITDTGSGIAAKDLPYIFTRFYKGDSNTGTGLGLSIVKEIIDQHGGRVSVESTEGKGTAVTAHLPVA